MSDDPLSEVEQRLGEIAKYARHPDLTDQPWWSDESGECWRLHGVFVRVPPQMDGEIAEQILNKQILKAAKSGTPYAEYWPEPADGEFIVKSRTDLPKLVAAIEGALKSIREMNAGADAAAAAGLLSPDDVSVIKHVTGEIVNRFTEAISGKAGDLYGTWHIITPDEGC